MEQYLVRALELLFWLTVMIPAVVIAYLIWVSLYHGYLNTMDWIRNAPRNLGEIFFPPRNKKGKRKK